ncbi:MAG TPA: WG repeat-containing protein [Candidatus Acidoferrum sp.]|nr:WG repeat-containing protein [Candidatus Acidoferrum sp.]
MKSRLLPALALAALLSGCVPASVTPQPQPEEEPIGYGWIVTPKYAQAGEFSEGFCPVSTGDAKGPWGYIDTAGAMQIPAYWDAAYPFSGGRACVAAAGLYGMIDTAGHVVAEPFSGTPLVSSGGLIACRIDGGYGYLDETGAPSIPFVFEDAKNFAEELAVVRKDGLWGVIGPEGDFVVDAAWEGAEVLPGGAIALYDGALWGLADRSGNILYLPRFQQLKAVGGGLYAYREADLWGVTNAVGRQLTEAVYADVVSCDGGEFLRLVSQTDTYVNTKLEEIDIPLPGGIRVSGGFVSGFAACIDGEGKWGVVARDGAIAVAPQREDPITGEELAAYAQCGLLRLADGYVGAGLTVSGLESVSLPYVGGDGRTYAMLKKDGLWGLAVIEKPA